MRTPRHLVPLLLGGAAVAFGLFAEDQRRQAGRPLDLAALDLLAGFVFVAAGLVVYLRRPANRSWWLLMAAGGTWFLSTLAGSLVENLAITGFVTGAWHYLFLGWLLLAFPSGRVGTTVGHLLLGALAVMLAVRSAVRLWLYVPPDGTGCDCVSNQFSGVTDGRWYAGYENVFPWLLAVVFAAVVADVVVRWRRSSGPGRRVLTPVLALGVAVAVQIAYTQVVRQELSWAVVRAEELFVVVVLVRGVAAASFAAGILRTRSARSAVVGVMGGLEENADPDRLATALRRALEDPSLVLLPWSSTAGGYVDTSGRAAVPAAGRGQAVTLIAGDHGSPVAALVHDEALLEDPGLVSAITATVRLTIDNERLRRELQDRLDDLAASQVRIIAAGDAERRRIERDLHDGIQQRLVAIALRLRLALERLPDDEEGNGGQARDVLATAVADLGSAAEEVRRLARGIHPAILEEAGLQAALESLVDRSPIDVRTDFAVLTEPPPGVGATAYFAVAEALTNAVKHAEGRDVGVAARTVGDRLHVVVTDDGPGGAVNGSGSGLTGLADRVRATGGSLTVTSPEGGGTRIEVDLPCA